MLRAGPFVYVLNVSLYAGLVDVIAEPISVNQGSMLNLVPDSPENLQVSLPE